MPMAEESKLRRSIHAEFCEESISPVSCNINVQLRKTPQKFLKMPKKVWVIESSQLLFLRLRLGSAALTRTWGRYSCLHWDGHGHSQRPGTCRSSRNALRGKPGDFPFFCGSVTKVRPENS